MAPCTGGNRNTPDSHDSGRPACTPPKFVPLCHAAQVQGSSCTPGTKSHLQKNQREGIKKQGCSQRQPQATFLCPMGWFCMTLSHRCSSKGAHFQTAGCKLAKIWVFPGAPGFFIRPRCTFRCQLWSKISPWKKKSFAAALPSSLYHVHTVALLLRSSRHHTASLRSGKQGSATPGERCCHPHSS